MNIDEYECVWLKSLDDEAGFFALMGRFFASANVRRDCGGYPLCDNPRYLWLVIKHRNSTRVLGFISVERVNGQARIRQAYLRPEERGQGLFRRLLRHVLDEADRLGLTCTTTVMKKDAPFLERGGFQIQSCRGQWIHMLRKPHARSHDPDQENRSPAQRVKWFASSQKNSGHQSYPPNAT